MSHFIVQTDLDKENREVMEEAVDEDIRSFSEWFQRRVGDGPLIHAERAILKTFMYYKLYGDSDEKAGS